MEAKLSALEDRIVFLSEQLERLEDYIEKEVYHKWQLEKSQGSSGYAKSSWMLRKQSAIRLPEIIVMVF